MNQRNLFPPFIFLFIFLIGLYAANELEKTRDIVNRNDVREIAYGKAQTIEQQLKTSLSSTFALASVIRQRGGTISDFDSLANEVIKEYPGVTNLQLAPDAIVSQIYPLSGNEQAIGHNLLQDPKRRTEALAAIKSKKLTLAGPFELIQGGTACIGRYPVFLSDGGDEKFWGFTIALIKMSDFIKTTSVNQLAESGYDYKLWRVDPDTGKKAIFAKSTDKKLDNPISEIIDVPNGKWFLSIAPKTGWRTSSSWYVEIGLILLVSSLGAVMVSRLIGQAETLRTEVEIRTKELNRIGRDNRKIADTLQQAILAIPERLEGINFGHAYHSATVSADVGGDFFDLFEIEHNKIGIVIGDISGKGLAAASLNSIVKNTIKAYSFSENEPCDVIRLTHDLVKKITSDSSFASVFYGILEVKNKKLTYCNAGHPEPIIIRKTGNTETLRERTTVIGTFLDTECSSGETAIERGDLLLLYTDGVIETRSGTDFYGEKRLIKKVAEIKGSRTYEIPDRILEDVMDYGGSKLYDDIAILSISLK